MTEIALKNKPVHDENYWMTVLLYFASFLVGLGIISLVAANWQQISNTLKMGGALGLMVLNSLAIAWTIKTDKPILKQVLCVVYAFLIMAVLGLIGQIFQLRADPAKACLAWGLLSWPLFLIAPRLLWLWIPLFFFGLHYMPPAVMSSIRSEIFHTWESGETADWYLALSTIAVYLLILAYEFYVNFAKQPKNTATNPLRFYCGVILWGLCSRAAEYALNSQPLSIGCLREIIVPCVLVGGIVLALNKMHQRRSFMPLFLGAVIVEYLYTLTCQTLSIGSTYKYFFTSHSVETELPLMFLLSISVYAHFNQMKRLFKLSGISLLIWFAWTFSDNMFDLVPSLIVCGFAAFWAYKAHNKRWFNVAVIAAVLRILGEYSDVNNLTYFGIYLICSGLLVIITILLLMKYGKKLWEKNDEE